MFHVGQQIVCIDDSMWKINRNGMPFPLIKGEVYTVSSLCTCSKGQPGVRIEEWPENNWHTGQFLQSRFRPIAKTDISIFTAMLQPQDKKVEA